MAGRGPWPVSRVSWAFATWAVVLVLWAEPGAALQLSPPPIPVGAYAGGLALSPSGDRLYVLSNGDGAIRFFDTSTRQLVRPPIVVGTGERLAVSRDGQWLYVAAGSVLAIEVATGAVTGISFSLSSDLVFSLDGKKLYVSDRNASLVGVVDTDPGSPTFNTVAKQIVLADEEPYGLALSPDGSRVYVSNRQNLARTETSVDVIDTTNDVLLPPRAVLTLGPGGGVSRLVVSSDGQRIYVTNESSNDVAVLDAASVSQIDVIHTGGAALRDVAIAPDEQTLLLSAKSPTDALLAININSKGLIQAIPISSPVFIALTEVPTPLVYVSVYSDPGSVQVIATGGSLLSLGPATVWVGLKNSDDQGTQFDLRAEVYVNQTLVAAGEALCVTGITRNPSKATEVGIAFGAPSGATYASGDTVSVRVLTRIGTTAGGSKCSGPGGSHSSAVGLQLYYDSTSRPSRLGVELTAGSLETFFLRSIPSDVLDPIAPAGTAAKFKASPPVSFSNGNPWKEIAVWGLPLP
jgi:YVTN family beta-propeller protein